MTSDVDQLLVILQEETLLDVLVYSKEMSEQERERVKYSERVWTYLGVIETPVAIYMLSIFEAIWIKI